MQNLKMRFRLAKFQDFVLSLMISRPISRSHKLATDFSCFPKVKLQNIFGAVGFVSELDNPDL